MEHDLCNVGIIGSGPAGCCCAYFIKKFCPEIKVTLFDFKKPLSTILPTGNGRCNLGYSEYDFRELAKNYPRGEKFLYSIFSKFNTQNTIEMFEELGVKTYTQEDNRIFPVSNSSETVKSAFLNQLSNYKFVKEKVLRIEKEADFKIVTDMNSYHFDKIVYSVGSHYGYEMVERLGINVVDFKPALTGLVTKEKFSNLKGIALKNIFNHEINEKGDIIFTHFGVSGPLIYKISSLKSRDKLPYQLNFDLVPYEYDLQNELNSNPHKIIKNLLSDILPQRLCEDILIKAGIDVNQKCHTINGKIRDIILEKIHNFNITVINTQKDGETVNSGGVDLKYINPKTMESKQIDNLYFCGEIIDVDGFCGGFNLQNCWSTAYIVANAIREC